MRHATVLLATALVAAACQGAPATSPTAQPAASPEATPAAVPATATPSPVVTAPPTATPTEAPTVTPTEEPTAPPSPTPQASPPSPSPTGDTSAVELFLDDMTDPQSGWGVADGERGSVSYADGALQLDTIFSGAFVWSTRPVAGSWDVMRVEGLAIAEPGGSGYMGLMCVNAAHQTMGALVSTAGGWVFMGITDDAVTVLDFDLEAGIELGDDLLQVTVDCVNSSTGGTTLTLYVNGTEVASHAATEGIGPFEQVGVYAEAQSDEYTVYFDGVRAVGASDTAFLPPVVSADPAALLEHVPEAFVDGCEVTTVAMLEPGSVAAVACALGGEAADVIEYVQFDSRESMDAAYRQRVESYAAEVVGTTCSEGPSELAYDIDGVVAGRLFCAPETVGIRLDWTDERLNILSSIVDYDADQYSSLFEVWLAAGPEL